jgi:hypothetical protein
MTANCTVNLETLNLPDMDEWAVDRPYSWDMKRTIAITASVLSLSFISTSTVHASQPSKKFKNCTELRKTFPKGVAKDTNSAGNTGATVNAKVYNANSGSDRDKDGVACELS